MNEYKEAALKEALDALRSMSKEDFNELYDPSKNSIGPTCNSYLGFVKEEFNDQNKVVIYTDYYHVDFDKSFSSNCANDLPMAVAA